MTYAVLAICLPFALIIAFLLWTFLRKSPEQKAQIAFRKIKEFVDRSNDRGCKARYLHTLPTLVEAVKDLDVAYLRIFLNRLKRDYPQ